MRALSCLSLPMSPLLISARTFPSHPRLLRCPISLDNLIFSHPDTNRTRLVRKAVPVDSFFNFFQPPQPASDEDIENGKYDDDELEELENKLELDYQIGEDFKEKVSQVHLITEWRLAAVGLMSTSVSMWRIEADTFSVAKRLFPVRLITLPARPCNMNWRTSFILTTMLIMRFVAFHPSLYLAERLPCRTSTRHSRQPTVFWFTVRPCNRNIGFW